MPSMENTRGSSWQPSVSLDRASVDGYNAHRDMPSSNRGGEWTRRREPAGPSSEDGTESSRGHQRRTPEARAKDQAMWPNPWMRTHWDPENPLDLNKPIRDENAPLDGDELETRAFQPAFPMDLNHLVHSLWTPKPPPPPSPSMRSLGNTREMRRQRSGSPLPPSSSLSSSYETPSSMRDGRNQAPMYDARRSVDEYEFRSRRRETPPPQPIDPRMSADMDAWSHRQQAARDPWQTGDDELRSRPAPPGPGYYKDRDYPSSRRERPYLLSDRQADLSRDFGPQQASRRRDPQGRRYDDPYRGYSSEDNARAPTAYRESHDGGRRHPFSMDAREAAREAEAAAMARLSQDRGVDPRMDPRMVPRAGPQLRRVVSAPSSDLLCPERRHEPRYHRDERSGQAPAPFLSAHPTAAHSQQQQQQRGPTLARAQSEGSLDDEEGYDV